MIYFVQAASGGDIKIGTTGNLGARLLQLECSSGKLVVLGVAEGSFPEETALHKRFAHLCTGGEWFHPAEELLAFISETAQPWDGLIGRVRITLDVPERIRRALNVEAACWDISAGEIVERLVTEHCQKSLQIADEGIAECPPTDTNKRGRPRKRPD